MLTRSRPQWHCKKNLRKRMDAWSKGVTKAVRTMLDRVEVAAKGQSLCLTDTAIETVVSKLRAALRTQFEAEYKEFIDAAEAVQAAGAVSDVEIARAQADEAAQEALARKLHAIDHGAVGSDPPTHRRAA